MLLRWLGSTSYSESTTPELWLCISKSHPFYSLFLSPATAGLFAMPTYHYPILFVPELLSFNTSQAAARLRVCLDRLCLAGYARLGEGRHTLFSFFDPVRPSPCCPYNRPSTFCQGRRWLEQFSSFSLLTNISKIYSRFIYDLVRDEKKKNSFFQR